MGTNILLSIRGYVRSQIVKGIPSEVVGASPLYVYHTVKPGSVEVVGKIVEEKGKWKRRFRDLLSMCSHRKDRKYLLEPIDDPYKRTEIKARVKALTGVEDVKFNETPQEFVYSPLNLIIISKVQKYHSLKNVEMVIKV